MGSSVHTVVIVTGYLRDHVKDAHRHAQHLGLNVTSIADHTVNSGMTFCVVPHGSKDGWDTATEKNAARGGFISWLRRMDRYDWAEVAYADDYREREGLLRHSHDREADSDSDSSGGTT